MGWEGVVCKSARGECLEKNGSINIHMSVSHGFPKGMILVSPFS